MRVRQPKRVLDLFCGAGGAAMGLHQAWPGAEIVGVDIKPQPRYPFTFVLADAMAFPLEGFDFVWASPPCQRYTQMLNHGRTAREKHPDLIAATRDRLERIPHVIENVMAAPIRRDAVLCGEMFGLRVIRHRAFECSFPVKSPAHKAHRGTGNRKQGDGGYYLRVYGHETSKPLWGDAMGIEWMKTPELAQAVPPAYSRYIAEEWSNTEGHERRIKLCKTSNASSLLSKR